MQSNFDFLNGEWDFLYNCAREAEQNAITAPVTSAFYSRLALEQMVNWLYENEGYLNQPYNTNLAARMGEQTFREIIPPSIYQNIDYIRREGNIAAHQGKSSHKVSVPFCVVYSQPQIHHNDYSLPRLVVMMTTPLAPLDP